MDFDLQEIQEVQELVHYHWDTAAIICLRGGTLRYRDLQDAMMAWTGEHLSESVLNKTLSRLRHAGFVRKIGTDNRHNAPWELTPQGHVRLAKIGALGRTLREWR